MAEDRFANLAAVTCTESAANTLTFAKIDFGTAVFEKWGMILHRLEYYAYPTSANFNTVDDMFTAALVVSNNIASIVTDVSFADPAVVDKFVLSRKDIGTAASGFWWEVPRVKDFTGLPNRGVILAPAPLYLAVQGVGMASPVIVTARLYFTMRQLKPDEYWELVESRRVITT